MIGFVKSERKIYATMGQNKNLTKDMLKMKTE